MQRFTWPLVFSLALAGAFSSLARAQDTTAVAPPTRGEAEFTATAAERPSEDDLALRLSAGANLAYGNTRALGSALAGHFSVRRDQHAFETDLAWNYGLASTRILPVPGPMETANYEFGDWSENTNNFNGRLRYDFFLGPDDTIWAEGRVRYDPFALVVPQVTVQVGYQRSVFREENHRLWFDLGVDYSYQNYPEPLPRPPVGGVAPANQLNDRSILAYKVLLGYTNETDSGFTYNTRFELLGTLGETVPTEAVDGPQGNFGGEPGHLRMQWINQFRSRIEDWLQFSVDITGRFDSLPVGQFRPFEEQSNQPAVMFDLIATVNLVANFDLDGEAEEADEADEADEAATCPVCPEPCALEEAPPSPDATSDAEVPTTDGDREAGSGATEPLPTNEEGAPEMSASPSVGVTDGPNDAPPDDPAGEAASAPGADTPLP